jgi:hypothetical protein
VQRFLERLASDPGRPAGAALKVTSLVRTAAYQKLLRKAYANAVADSTHLTGAVLDISTKDMPQPTIEWLRSLLAQFERNHLVQATEETGRGGSKRLPGSACFHVFVSPAFLKAFPFPQAAPTHQPAR